MQGVATHLDTVGLSVNGTQGVEYPWPSVVPARACVANGEVNRQRLKVK